MSDGIMLDGKLLNPSDYLSAADLNGKDVTAEIESISRDELVMTGGRKETKAVIRFVKASKKLVLNKTNSRTIAAMYGLNANEWPGKKITLYPTTDKCKGKIVPCIRVREQIPVPKENQNNA